MSSNPKTRSYHIYQFDRGRGEQDPVRLLDLSITTFPQFAELTDEQAQALRDDGRIVVREIP